MKRHQSLYPLSRDHHEALVQARNLRLAAVTNDPDKLAQAAARFAGYWAGSLQAHFSQEEQFILPLLAQSTLSDGHEIRETLRQHAEITRLVAGLNDKLADREAIEADLLESISEALRSHIHYEESELFPAVEASASEEELWRMNKQLETERSRIGDPGCTLSPGR